MKVLIIDDEQEIRHLISKNLKLEGYETLVAENGKRGLTLIQSEQPDIVLLDIMLPDINGFDMLSQIQEIDPRLPVVFISALDKNSNKILGLELGADDYITKPFDSKELVSRVKALWRRMHYTSEVSQDNKDTRKEYKHIELDPLYHTLYVDGMKVELTFKEFNILYYLAKHENQILSREQLIAQIWGEDYVGNNRAVDVLIKRIRTKIEPYDHYIVSVYGAGYRFEEIGDET